MDVHVLEAHRATGPLATFDAPDREKCTGRRALTNTPLQALVPLNDPTYVEAARALAQRTLLEGGTNEKSRIACMFRLAMARKPSGQKTKVCASCSRRSWPPSRTPEGRDQAPGRGRVDADKTIDQSSLPRGPP